jgi:hypothetical protein
MPTPTVADLERARDRVAAAERRIDNDRRHAGLERAQLELSVIESQLRSRGLLRDDDDDEGKTPGGRPSRQSAGRTVIAPKKTFVAKLEPTRFPSIFAPNALLPRLRPRALVARAALRARMAGLAA